MTLLEEVYHLGAGSEVSKERLIAFPVSSLCLLLAGVQSVSSRLFLLPGLHSAIVESSPLKSFVQNKVFLMEDALFMMSYHSKRKIT